MLAKLNRESVEEPLAAFTFFCWFFILSKFRKWKKMPFVCGARFLVSRWLFCAYFHLHTANENVWRHDWKCVQLASTFVRHSQSSSTTFWAFLSSSPHCCSKTINCYRTYSPNYALSNPTTFSQTQIGATFPLSLLFNLLQFYKFKFLNVFHFSSFSLPLCNIFPPKMASTGEWMDFRSDWQWAIMALFS